MEICKWENLIDILILKGGEKMKKFLFFVFLFLFVLVLTLNGYVKDGPMHVLIATSGSASSFHVNSQTMWNVINK